MNDRDCWETPQWLFDELNEEFKFDIDLCANEDNMKCDFAFHDYLATPENLSLVYARRESNAHYLRPWKVGFMNPPYSNIKPFLEKAIEDAKNGKTVVAVLPVDTSTKWWRLIWDTVYHEPVSIPDKNNSAIYGIEIRFIPYLPHHPSRLKFEFEGRPHKDPYPRPVAVIVMRGKCYE